MVILLGRDSSFFLEGVGIGHMHPVCTIRSKFMSLEDTLEGKIEGKIEPISSGQCAQCCTIHDSWLLESQNLNQLTWLASLKTGFEEDEFLGHWLRTILKRISSATTVLLVSLREPWVGWAKLPIWYQIFSFWYAEYFFVPVRWKYYFNFSKHYLILGLQSWNEQWMSWTHLQ